MAPLGAIAGIAGAGLNAVGSVMQGRSQAAAMQHQAQAELNREAMGKFQAKEMRIAGLQQQAATQRAAGEAWEMGQYLLSGLQSGAAKSGFEGTSADVARLAGDLTSRLTLQEQNIRYEGKDRRRALNQQAKLTQAGAQQAGDAATYYQDAAGSASTAGLIGALGSAFGGLADFSLNRPAPATTTTARADPWAGMRAPSSMARYRYGYR